LTVRPENALGPPLIGALLRMPVDAVVARMLAGLHDAGFTDFVPAHLNVFRYPGPQGRRPSELAAETRMTKQAVNYLLRQLEELGYLTRTGDERDQRSKRIQLTERGLAAAESIRQTVRQIELELERELGPERFGELRSLLEDLNGTTLVRQHRARTA
jgi:DNA-binding MarR family transcriptional regulator